MKGQQTNNLLRQPWTVRCKYVRSSLRKSFLSVFDSRDAKVEKTILEEPQKGTRRHNKNPNNTGVKTHNTHASEDNFNLFFFFSLAIVNYALIRSINLLWVFVSFSWLWFYLSLVIDSLIFSNNYGKNFGFVYKNTLVCLLCGQSSKRRGASFYNCLPTGIRNASLTIRPVRGRGN